MHTATRTERDALGNFDVPASALYGIQTARAVANVPISGLHARDDAALGRVLAPEAMTTPGLPGEDGQ